MEEDWNFLPENRLDPSANRRIWRAWGCAQKSQSPQAPCVRLPLHIHEGDPSHDHTAACACGSQKASRSTISLSKIPKAGFCTLLPSMPTDYRITLYKLLIFNVKIFKNWNFFISRYLSLSIYFFFIILNLNIINF